MVKYVLYIYVVAILLVGCTNSDITPNSEENSTGMVEVKLSTLIDDGSNLSQAETDTRIGTEIFDNKDQIGVFLCKTGGEIEANTDLLMYHTTSSYRNLMAEFSSTNKEWLFFVSYTGFLIVPSVYDNNSTLEGNLDCYAYSPYIRTVSGDFDDEIYNDITKVPLVNGRDVMWAVGYDPNNPSDDSDVTEMSNQNIEVLVDQPLNITLKFKRAMTKINFEFNVKNEQVGVTVDSIILATTDKSFQTLRDGAIIDGRDGVMDLSSIIDTDTIKLASLLTLDSSPEDTTTYEALLIPFSMEQDDRETTDSGYVEVTLVVNGQRTYNSLPIRAMELLRGDSYTMKITIDNFLKISTSQGLTLDDNWYGEGEEIIL